MTLLTHRLTQEEIKHFKASEESGDYRLIENSDGSCVFVPKAPGIYGWPVFNTPMQQPIIVFNGVPSSQSLKIREPK